MYTSIIVRLAVGMIKCEKKVALPLVLHSHECSAITVPTFQDLQYRYSRRMNKRRFCS